ncbi:MAG: MaoC/PaaZ C-terminal domain-containing protein [Acidimicrobiia bacterium]
MLDDLLDKPFGPYRFRTGRERVTEFIATTTDDPDRWTGAAPPAFVAAGLFAAAAPFLNHPDVTAEAQSILHGEQAFRWFGPLPLGADLAVTARLRKLRRRGKTAFVWLTTALGPEEALAAEADSMFLLSAEDPEPGLESAEPEPSERGQSDRPAAIELPAEGGELPTMAKSASRMELVRYAAATGDWNPIHWDHQSAVRAGLPGVICHGLLMAAWVIQGATRTVTGSVPLAACRIRFRAPLLPATQAAVEGRVKEVRAGGATLAMRLTSTRIEHVAATVNVRSG